MSDAARQRVTPDKFLLWCLDQEDTYELVDGRPVLKFDNGPEMMAGASAAHDQIVVNLIGLLRDRLRGGPCRVKTAKQAARIPRGNIRRPDATIDCGTWRPDAYESAEPRVFFEVLSPSTRGFDLVRRDHEYRRAEGLRHFVLLEPDRPRALVWSASEDGEWTNEEIVGLDATLPLPDVGAALTMADIYEDVDLPAAEPAA